MVVKTRPPKRVRKDLHDLQREVHYKRDPQDQVTYQASLSDIYVDAVTDVINTYSMNAILGDLCG